MPSTLRTARLVLRPYTRADEDSFASLFEDETVTRWMGMPAGTPREIFRRSLTEESGVTWDLWAVVEDDTYVGHAELKPSRQVDGHELVYALLPDAWGRGLGAEVAAAVTDHALTTLAIPEVHATVDPANAASLTLLRRLGYVDIRDLTDTGETVRLLTRRR